MVTFCVTDNSYLQKFRWVLNNGFFFFSFLKCWRRLLCKKLSTSEAPRQSCFVPVNQENCEIIARIGTRSSLWGVSGKFRKNFVRMLVFSALFIYFYFSHVAYCTHIFEFHSKTRRASKSNNCYSILKLVGK